MPRAIGVLFTVLLVAPGPVAAGAETANPDATTSIRVLFETDHAAAVATDPPELVSEVIPPPSPAPYAANLRPVAIPDRGLQQAPVQVESMAGLVTSHHAACPPQPRGSLSGWYHNRFKPCMQATHWGYPEYFCERPFGSYLRAHYQGHVAAGAAAQMVLYHYDFYDGTLNEAGCLNTAGRQKLNALLPWLACQGGPIVIQTTRGQPELDAARREHVLTLLSQTPLMITESSVVVGVPEAPGICGVEALLIYGNLLEQMEARGLGAAGPTAGGVGEGGGGDFGPGGFAPGTTGLP